MVAVVAVASHVMFSAAGIRMRMSFAAVMVATAASVTATALIAVAGAPTMKTWSSAEERVGETIVFVRLSVAATIVAVPSVNSCSAVAGDVAEKFMNRSPE